MHLEFEKRDQPFVDEANDDGLGARRIFVRVRKTKTSFVDTDADTCVYPRSKIHEQVNKTDCELFAANGTLIVTYGTITMSLDLPTLDFRVMFRDSRRSDAHHRRRFIEPPWVARGPAKQTTPRHDNLNCHQRDMLLRPKRSLSKPYSANRFTTDF